MDAIRDYKVEITSAHIADLRARLSRTRWPEPETVHDWSQGVPLSYLGDLVEYWMHGYDMHRLQDRLNEHPQFYTTIDDLGIHFIHIRSRHDNARPLLLTHGWPGSILEFLSIIDPLADPTAHGGRAEDAFHLVIPALPGFGFSDKPTRTGTGMERIGTVWDQLMTTLGYPAYFAQGGDWGALITAAMATAPPPGLLGIHLNFALADPATLSTFSGLTAEEASAGGIQHYLDHEAGYSTQQATRPQTLGYGLADSPVAQLAWIAEKFHAWTDRESQQENRISRDVLLDNVMLYWLTNSAASSARLYWESFAKVLTNFPTINIPTAYSQFPKDLFTISERWLRTRYLNLRYYHTLERGGHFAALEQPELFTREVRADIQAIHTR